MTKITIQEIIKLKAGNSFTLAPHSNFMVADNKIVVTKQEIPPSVISKLDPKIPEEEESEEDQEFRLKWQIKEGSYVLHSEKGLVPVLSHDELYFETQTSRKLASIFDTFYKNIHIAYKYKKLKRSYLLHSPPGMGKSALIRHLCKKVRALPGTAVIEVDGEVNFNLLSHIFMREYNPNVKSIVLVVEDMGRKDYITNANLYNASCLNFLDGNQSLFRVPTMILCTTNFAKELGPQFTNRPGRFNRIIKVEPPTDEEVFELVEGFGDIKLTDEQKMAFTGKELTPDHCVEAIIRHELEEIPLDQAVHDLLQERIGLISGLNTP